MEMARELDRRVLGLGAQKGLERRANGLMEIGALDAIQALIQILLKENVSEAIDRESLTSRALHVDGTNELITLVGLVAQETHDFTLVDPFESCSDLSRQIFTLDTSDSG